MKNEKMIIAILTGGLFSVRLCLTALVFSRNNPGGYVLGIISVIALVTTVNAWRSGQPDLTPRGLAVGMGHLVVLLLIPGAPVPVWQVVFWVAVVVQCWAKLSLAGRTTVTGPVYVSLCERGLYRFVRHPMTATEFLIALIIVCEHPISHNWLALCAVAMSKYCITIMEEQFLLSFPHYVAYAKRVRFRCIPGVW